MPSCLHMINAKSRDTSIKLKTICLIKINIAVLMARLHKSLIAQLARQHEPLGNLLCMALEHLIHVDTCTPKDEKENLKNLNTNSQQDQQSTKKKQSHVTLSILCFSAAGFCFHIVPVFASTLC